MIHHALLPAQSHTDPGRARMGARKPDGSGIWINDRCFMLDSVPFIPIMGEIHYSRYPSGLWRKALLKMKNSGITVASTYVFWNHHEEIQGQFDWSGVRNLRGFIEAVKDCGLFLWLRIGPWCHGEARYGGFPDWVQALPDARCNSEPYLGYVDRLYGEIAEQAKGLLYKDGGPVIGMQLENEYWQQGPGAGKEHMLTLKDMTICHGLAVPFYTATGWSGDTVPTDEIMPVYGEYPEEPWAQHIQELEPGYRYFFHPCIFGSTIGTDLIQKTDAVEGRVTHGWPYMTCEVGGGNQITWHRRPILSSNDIVAVSFCLLCSGSILPGYYMFHGGANPDGKLTTLQESRETGYENDLPAKSYDFQAPLGEYGEGRPWLDSLRRMHLFIESNKTLLAHSDTVIPDGIPADLFDVNRLRWSLRYHESSGFVFLNNYQRHTNMIRHEGLTFDLELPGGRFQFPFKPMILPSGAFTALPFNMMLGPAKLRHATCQPITCCSDGSHLAWFFYAPDGIEPELAFQSEDITSVSCVVGKYRDENGFWIIDSLSPGIDSWIDLNCIDGRTVSICILDEASSLKLRRLHTNSREYIVMTSADTWQEGFTLCLSQPDKRFETLVYPKLPDAPGWDMLESGRYTLLRKDATCFADAGVTVEPQWIMEACGQWQIIININNVAGLDELFLDIEYEGDKASLFLDGSLIADHFYDGRIWKVGLMRFLGEAMELQMTLQIKRLHGEAEVYFEPGYRQAGSLLKLSHVSLGFMQRQQLQLKDL